MLNYFLLIYFNDFLVSMLKKFFAWLVLTMTRRALKSQLSWSLEYAIVFFLVFLRCKFL